MLGIVAMHTLVIVPGILSGPEDFFGLSVFRISDKSCSVRGVNLNVGMFSYFTFRSSKYCFCLLWSIFIFSLRLVPILVKNLLNCSAISILSVVIIPCSFFSSEHSALTLFFLPVSSFSFCQIFLLFLKFSLK